MFEFTKKAKDTKPARQPRRTAIINTFGCLECGKKYFYRILRCPTCESAKIGALQNVVIIP